MTGCGRGGRRYDFSRSERVILPTEVGSVLARVRPSRSVIWAALTLADLATMVTTRVKGLGLGIGEGERAEGGHLIGLIFEAAVHALLHLRALLAEEQDRKDADDDDLEEDESGHELAANRSWSEAAT